ncbi:HAD family hydrolase [Candidatus Saccharibacteria bacterium]|nr:HAD family hydrolase [Candidatus Saccharibacteria bacterium]
MKKYILLDWDGNLARTLDIWLDACHIAINNQGIQKTDEEIAASFGQFTKYLTEWGISDVNAAIEDADKVAKKQLPEVELYPDAAAVLETLKEQGKKLALITTSPHENIQHLLEKHGLGSMFDVIVAGDDVENHKPHPEPLDTAIEQLGGNKEDSIMIGDSDKDLGASENAGVDSILFYPPEHERFYSLESLKSHNPTYVVSDFKDVIDIVN